MKIVVIIITLFLPIILFCQTKVDIIKGKVVDVDSNYNMLGTNISLINKIIADSVAQNRNYKPTNVIVYGNVVDKNGNYEIKNVPPGEYIIKCYSVGYKTEIDTIELRKNYGEIIKDFYMKVQPIKGIY